MQTNLKTNQKSEEIKSMNFNNFITEVKLTLREFFNDNILVEDKTVLKNNGVRLTGIVIIEGNKNCVPNIYLNEYYEQFKQGKSIYEIAYEISKYYESHKLKKQINMEFYSDYERVKKKLCFRLVNFEKNRELLKQIPYVPYMDLAMVFYCMIQNEAIQNGSILVKNEKMKKWDVDIDTLKRDAYENTQRILKGEIVSMEDVICDMMKHKLMVEIEKCIKEQMEARIMVTEEMVVPIVEEMMRETYTDAKGPKMYVASNQNRNFGAAVILYSSFLMDFANQTESDYYILPSSIHEVILVPKEDKEQEIEHLKKMVEEVNHTEMSEEEILSNSVYLYTRKENQIIRVN